MCNCMAGFEDHDGESICRPSYAMMCPQCEHGCDSLIIATFEDGEIHSGFEMIPTINNPNAINTASTTSTTGS